MIGYLAAAQCQRRREVVARKAKPRPCKLATAAYAGDAEKAKTALDAVNNGCKSCHDAHREKIAEGKYRIK